MRYRIIKDPSVNLLDFNIDAYRDRIDAASAIIDSTHPDLSRFFARGGRLYVLPNGSHGGQSVSGRDGKPIPHHVDLIGMAIDWVENGIVPPDAPVLRAMSPVPPYTVTATRPMCRYPLYARYIGTGDPGKAESFTCKQP